MTLTPKTAKECLRIILCEYMARGKTIADTRQMLFGVWAELQESISTWPEYECLRELSTITGGWYHIPDDSDIAEFIEMSNWLPMFQRWEERVFGKERSNS